MSSTKFTYDNNEFLNRRTGIPPRFGAGMPEVDDRVGTDLPNNLFPTARHVLSHHARAQHVQLFAIQRTIRPSLAVF